MTSRTRHSGQAIAVIGGGVIGSAVAWQLAVRGHRVVLFEQYGPGHVRGASHGSARIFRHAFPAREYINLASRAARLWRQLERLDGRRVYARTGAVDHGDPRRIQPLARALAVAGLEHALLSPRTAEQQWPGLSFDTMVLHHTEAGRLHADQAVAALQRRARAEGAEICHHTAVDGLRANSTGARVLLAAGSLRFDQAVVATGAWTHELLAGVPEMAAGLPALTTTQQQPVHFVPVETPVGWPSFSHHPGVGYTGPAVDGQACEDGIRVGAPGIGRRIEPDTRDFRPDPSGVVQLQQYAARWLPGVDAGAANATTHLSTSTADGHFVVDRQGPVTVAAGFADHGFTFAPAIGELVAGLVNGTAEPLELFTLKRRRHPVPAGGVRDG